jgi:hypothetical protein
VRKHVPRWYQCSCELTQLEDLSWLLRQPQLEGLDPPAADVIPEELDKDAELQEQVHDEGGVGMPFAGEDVDQLQHNTMPANSGSKPSDKILRGHTTHNKQRTAQTSLTRQSPVSGVGEL